MYLIITITVIIRRVKSRARGDRYIGRHCGRCVCNYYHRSVRSRDAHGRRREQVPAVTSLRLSPEGVKRRSISGRSVRTTRTHARSAARSSI